jgi:hypothetical protein
MSNGEFVASCPSLTLGTSRAGTSVTKVQDDTEASHRKGHTNAAINAAHALPRI